METKLIKVLELFLSLHEADEIYSMILIDEYTVEDILKKIDEYKSEYKKS